MEEGGSGRVNLVTGERICEELEFGCGNEVNLGDGEGYVTELQEGNGRGVVVHDPLASWNGIDFGDLLARADMGKVEPLLDFSSDSVRCSSSRFFVPGNGDVVALDVRAWASNRHVSESPGGSIKNATEGSIEQLLHTDETQNSVAINTIPVDNLSPVEGGKEIPDLNDTPQQKAKRRKHRPKVIIEGQVKKPRKEKASVPTPKSTDGAEKKKTVRKKNTSDMDNPTSKRKYVRKNVPNKSSSASQAGGGEKAGRKGSNNSKKSCKKVLNFDSDSQADNDKPQLAPGAKENPILLSDSDIDREQKFLTISGRKIRIQQQVRGDSKGMGNKLRHSVNIMRRRLMKVSDAKYSSSLTYKQINKNGFKDTHVLIDLEDSANIQGEDHSSTTSSTSSTVTNSITNKKLVEWWHCNPMALPTSNTNAVDSISNIKKDLTDKLPAQDANVESSSSKDADKQALSYNYIQERGKLSISATATQDRARLARRNQVQKRKKDQILPRKGVNMGQLTNGSRPIPIAPHVDAMWAYLISVEDIVERMKDLDINRETIIPHNRCNALVPFETCYRKRSLPVSRKKQREEQKELVIYNHNGTLVQFDSSQIRKRRPRAKVDLDEETSRVWTLLLENINSQGVDGTDEEKARWWENERKVFSGRANSFIARMHLVQGDRRFSKWKGSVVDSVVGVFLTQNVSDHLSSSAFMSLAARFPLKRNSNDEQCYKEGHCSASTKVEMHVMHPEEESPISETSNDPISDPISSVINSEHIEQKPVSSCEGAITSGTLSSTNRSNCKLSVFGTELEKFVKTIGNQLNSSSASGMLCATENQQSPLDEVVSSQSSVNQSSLGSPSQTDDHNGSNSVRNVEIDPAVVSLPKAYGGSTSFLELLKMVGCPGNQEGSLRCSADGSTSKGLQNGGDETSLHGQLTNETDRTKDFTSSSTELRILSGDGLTDNRFDPIETDSSRTPGRDIMPCEFSIDEEGTMLSKQACFECMPPNSESYTNKDGINTGDMLADMSSIVVPVDQDQPEVGKRGFRSLNMTSQLADMCESIKPSKSKKPTIDHSSDRAFYESNIQSLKAKRRRVGKDINHQFDWEGLRQGTKVNGKTRGKTHETMDSLDYEAVRSAEVNDIAYTIRDRGMNNVLAGRIKDFLNRLANEHGSIDLEWLRDVPPDQAKEYLLSIRGLGLKSVECVRLLTLHHLAFPVDTNVGRIAVRLGWVPLQPLPESLQLHLLEMYPVQESIQKYLWPRLCKLDQKTLYELHYQMITFGKVFCTKSKPNCNSCPMRGECRHFASAFASARLALSGPEEKKIVPLNGQRSHNQGSHQVPEGFPIQVPMLPHIENQQQSPQENLQISQLPEPQSKLISCEPIIEEPKSPEIECVQIEEKDIEDWGCEESDEIPEIKLNIEEFTQSLQNYIHANMEIEEGDVSRALVALTPEAASIPAPKLKNVSMLRTEHHVYELPDSHPLLEGLDKREPDDPCSYLLAIWTPGETATSVQPPEPCTSAETGKLCDKETCPSCNGAREANSHTVRGTLLIPCRTAMRGSFPLNGTYFQVNEVFADHDSSLNPMNIPRKWLWNLPRRNVYFGTSIPTIFKGLSTEGIQQCFWRGYVCVRGFDQKTRAPRPLLARLHFPASKVSRTKGGKPSGE